MDLWDVLISIFWLMLMVSWFWVIVMVISDAIRDQETSGFAKAMWCLFVIAVPWLGVLVYLMVNGNSMGSRATERDLRLQEGWGSRDRGGLTAELAQLGQLRDSGALSPQEYELAKTRVLGPAAV